MSRHSGCRRCIPALTIIQSNFEMKTAPEGAVFSCLLGHRPPPPEFRGNLRERGPRSFRNKTQGLRPPWGYTGVGRRVGVLGAARAAARGWERTAAGTRRAGAGARRRRYARVRERGRGRLGAWAFKGAVFRRKNGLLPDGVCRVSPLQATKKAPESGGENPGFPALLSHVHKFRAAGLCTKSGCYFAAAER